MKKLQVALDLLSTEDAKEMLKKVGDYVDIIELGTPLMVSEGADVIREIKPLYPEKTVFAENYGWRFYHGGYRISGRGRYGVRISAGKRCNHSGCYQNREEISW